MESQTIRTAQQLASKGIFASDESPSTIGKRLNKLNIENTQVNRTRYRDTLYSTPGIAQFLSGIIFNAEALDQKSEISSQNESLMETVQKQGVLVGVKVDKGLEPIGDSPEENQTKGLDTLKEECKLYQSKGATFSKWRAALKVGEGYPSDSAIQITSKQLAKYAKISQVCGLTPIVEPEVLINGPHSIDQFYEASLRVLGQVIKDLQSEKVVLEGCLLKCSIILPGSECQEKVSAQLVAEKTLEVLEKVVPKEIPGIVFLSGGLSEIDASIYLNEINIQANKNKDLYPWALSFSYGRALQASALQIWSQDQENIVNAQKNFIQTCEINYLASKGKLQINSSFKHPSIQQQSSLVESYRGHF